MEQGILERLSARWWDEVWGAGDLDVLDDILTDPFTRHTADGTFTAPRAEYKQLLRGTQNTLRGVKTTIDDRQFGHDRIWTRATSRGVNLQTGDPVVISWLLVQRVEGGRFAEHWLLTARGVDWTR